MSFSTRVSDALVRVGTEVKSVRALANSKYTKPTDGIPYADLGPDIKYGILEIASRWEAEVLVQPGTRVTGFGPAPLGINVPYPIKIMGIKYQFETPTTTGNTFGSLWVNRDYNLNSVGAQMGVAAGGPGQIINNLNINISPGNRLALEVTAIGTAGVGKGLYMSLWGQYT